MAIQFKCQCGKAFKVDESFGGKRTKCPSCGAVVTIPKAEAPPSGAKPQFRLAEEPAKPPAPAGGGELALEDEGIGVGGKVGETAAPPAAPPPPPPSPPVAPPAGGKQKSDETELGLEVETLGVGGKTDATPAAPPAAPPPPPKAAEEPAMDLGIEVETMGVGGKIGGEPPAKTPPTVKPPDSSKDEIPIELPAEAPPPAPEAAAPAPALAPEPAKASDAKPAAAPAPAAAERKCPKCGAAVVGNAVICLECGTPLSGPAAAKAAPKGKLPAKLAPAIDWVKGHKIPVIAGAAVIVIGLGAGGFFLFKKKQAQTLAAAATTTVTQAQAAAAVTTTTTTTTLPPKWERQFSSAALNARRDLEDYRLARSASGGKAVEPAQVPATVKVVPEVAGVTRFRPVAYVPADKVYSQVLFSDGSIRLMHDADRSMVEVRAAADGPTTSADAALRQRASAEIQVANSRLSSVEVRIDGKAVGQATPDAGVTVDVTPGPHEVVLSFGGAQTTPLKIDAAPGVTELLFVARQQDLPFLPVKNYRAAMTTMTAVTPTGAGGPAAAYTAERTSAGVTGVKSAVERVVFGTPGGRGAISQDGRTLEARIERDEATIEGVDGKTIHLNDLGRVEEGVVKYRNGATITYRRTEIGPVGWQSLPSLDLADIGRMRGAARMGGLGDPVSAMPGAPGFRGASAERRALDHPEAQMSASPGGMAPGTGPDAAKGLVSRSERLTAVVTPFAPNPDMDAVGRLLKTPTAVTLLLARLGKTAPVSKPAGAGAAMSGAPEPAPTAPGMPAMARGPGVAGGPAGDTRRPGAVGGAQAVGLLPTPQDAQVRDLADDKVLAMLAVLGEPAATSPVAALMKSLDPKANGYGEGLLALARCGREAMTPTIRAAVENSRVYSTIAFALIDNPAARQALPSLVVGWTAKELGEAAAAWPGVGGPSSRRALVEAVLGANPALLDDPDALNSLLRFEPYALERALLARIAVAPKVPEAPPKEGTPTAAKDAPAPTPTPGAKPADKPTDGSADLSSGAPYSWLALARTHSVEGIAWYVALLKDKDALKRRAALEALAETPDAALSALAASMVKDADPGVRRAAAVYLVRVGDAASVKALTEGMTKDLALPAICDAAPALMRTAGTKETGELLVKMLTLVYEAAKPADAKTPPTAPHAEAPGAPVGAARGESATAMDVLRAIERAHVQLDGAQVDAVKKLLTATEIAVRSAALELVLSSRPGDAAAVIEAGLKDAAPEVRLAALTRAGRLPAAARAGLLKAAAKDPEARVRAEAMRATRGLDDAAAREILSAGLSDAIPAVVTAAARTAAMSADPALGEAICGVLNKQSAPAAEAAPSVIALIDAAVALHAKNAPGSLMLLMAGSNAEVRAAAAAGLGRLRTANSVPALLTALQDKDPLVSAAALDALGEIDSPQARQASLAALQSKDLPAPARQKILFAAMASARPGGPGAAWAENANLGEADLTILAAAAGGAPKEWHAPLVTIARRYITATKPEMRRLAGAILAATADDPEARKLLMESWERDATGLGFAVASALRRSGEATPESELLRRYRQLSEPGRWPGIAKETPEEALAVRVALIEAAGRLPGDEAVRALRSMMSLESSPFLLSRVIAALAEGSSAAGVQYLSDLAAPGSIVRADGLTPAVIEAISRAGRTQPAKAAEALARLTRSHMPADVTAAATDAMARLGALPAEK